MNEPLQISIYLIALFMASCGIAYAVTKLTQASRRRSFPELSPLTSATVRHQSGRYRCRLSEVCGDSLTFDAPMVADAPIPFRAGDTIKIELPLKKGVLLFFAEVAGRDDTGRRFAVAIPDRFQVEDRRAHVRQSFEEGVVTRLNGRSAVLLNISHGGAALLAHTDAEVGELVRVEDEFQDVRVACVLEITPEVLDGRIASRLRVVFS